MLLENSGYDVLEKGIAVVSASGIGGLARWLRLYSAYTLPVFAIFDSDSREDPDGEKRADLLLAVDVPPQGYEASLAATPSPLVVEDNFAVLVSDFESMMRRLFPDYEALEQVARDSVGTGKPLIAREACRLLTAQSADHPSWKDIERLATAISSAMTGRGSSVTRA